MPFVTITLLEGKGKEYIKAVTDGINSAVIKTMDFPDDDRYQDASRPLQWWRLWPHGATCRWDTRYVLHLSRCGKPETCRSRPLEYAGLQEEMIPRWPWILNEHGSG